VHFLLIHFNIVLFVVSYSTRFVLSCRRASRRSVIHCDKQSPVYIIRPSQYTSFIFVNSYRLLFRTVSAFAEEVEHTVASCLVIFIL